MLVSEPLSDSCQLPEIIWYFCHSEGLEPEGRLLLAETPHFYANLPITPAGYLDSYSMPTVASYQGVIYVLKKNTRRVFLDCPRPRIFDSVWDINGILIFKS